jgi:hypothetical protein
LHAAAAEAWNVSRFAPHGAARLTEASFGGALGCVVSGRTRSR